MKFILASSSPRRKELLSSLGIKFDVIVKETDEKRNPKLGIKKQIMQIAIAKAEAIIDDINKFNNCVIISADTMIIYKKQFLGKPKDSNDAINMLKKLSGKKHKVITAMYIIVNKNNNITYHKIIDTTIVYFSPIDERNIKWYVSTKEPLDKAGSYAIQGIGSAFIKKIKGSFSTVVGLPTHKLHNFLVKENLI